MKLNVDQSRTGQIAVTGEDRVRFLHGMCTSNIEELEEGSAIRATILNAKGRLISIVEVVRQPDRLLLLCQPDIRDRTIDFLDSYALADDVELEPVEQQPLHRVWADPEAVWDAPPVFAPAPAPVATVEEVEVRRVEAGFPLYGVDVTDKNFPFETPLDRTIDYRKGCYIGQEPVARVSARGSANKYLRGLRVEGEGAVAIGAQVRHPERDNAGVVSSAVVSPEFGSIALALLHRSAWQPGACVEVDGRPAEVVELPFGEHRRTC